MAYDRYGQTRMMLGCHGWGYKRLQTASHIHIGCIQSVLAPYYAVNGHIGSPLHCNTCEGLGPNFEKLGYGRTWMTLWCHGWGCKRLQTVYHIHIGCIQNCFSTLICCKWGYGCYPYTVIPVEVGAKFWKIGVWADLNDIGMSWLRLQEASDYVPHPYWM
jgi:hypothetical protein